MMKVWNMHLKKVFFLVKNEKPLKKGIFDAIKKLFYMSIFGNFFFSPLFTLYCAHNKAILTRYVMTFIRTHL
jgi:hypothetical protein